MALLLAGTACRSGPQVTGTYDLIGVNGRRLPVRAGWVAVGTSEITGGSATLSPDGTYQYRLVFHVRTPARGDYADSSVQGGTYERRMSQVVLHAPGGDVSAQLAGATLTLTLGGWTYAFRKAEPGR